MGVNLMRKLIAVVVLVLGTFTSVYAADPIINIVANVAPQETFTYVGATVPPILSGSGTITPAGDPTENITAACWNVVDPIVVTLAVNSNYPTAKLVMYTKHKEQADYWNTAATAALPADVAINGLINTASITKDNWYNTTVSMRAFADVYNRGISTDNNDWGAWINDISGQVDYSKAGVLHTGDIVNDNLKVYIRTCWSKGKVAGAYKSKIFFTLTSQ